MFEATDPLHQLMLATVARRCAQESELFFRREPNDPRFCFELLRRAILDRDEHAWELSYSNYRPLVAGWITRHPDFPATGEELDFFVNAAFDKFWSALGPDKFALFSDLRSVLRYLQMCVHSVIVDHARLSERMAIRSWQEQGEGDDAHDLPAPTGDMLDDMERREFWTWLEARLRDEKERRVVYGSFFLALKPRELYGEYQELFRDQAEVYRVKENVLARLRRDPELRRFLGDDAGKMAD